MRGKRKPPDPPSASPTNVHCEQDTARVSPPKKRKRPDVSKRREARKGTATYTIKAGWASLDANPAVEAGVSHMLPVVHQASVEGALLAQTVILRRLRAGKNLPQLNATFFHRCFMQVTRNNERQTVPPPSSKEKCIAKGFVLYKQHRSASLPWPVKEHCSQALNWAAQGYLTACKNHVVQNFQSRIRKYWRRMLLGCVPRSRQALSALVRWLTDTLLSGEKLAHAQWEEQVANAFADRPHDALVAEFAFRQLQWVFVTRAGQGAPILPLTKKDIADKWQSCCPCCCG